MSLRRLLRTANTARAALTANASVGAAPRVLAVPALRTYSQPSPLRSAIRLYSSSTPHGDPGVDPSIPVRDLTDSEYQIAADETMDTLHDNIEVLCEDFGPETWEVEYSSGVMTLALPPHGTYVINKQPPNHQIWVSSPISGPSRFSMGEDGGWVHHRKQGVRLGALLDEELNGLLKENGVEGEWEGVGIQ